VRAPLAVCGNVAIDVIDGRPPTVGGGPYHCGLALRLLERPSRIVAKCAPADRALVVPLLAALGVPLTVVDGRETASFALSYDGEARRTELLAVGDAWSPEDVGAIDGIEWVHVAPLARTDFPPAALTALARGRRVSYDGQGLVRVPEPGPVRLDDGFDRSLLEHISFLKLAQEEAAAILPDPEDDAVFALGVPEVVITLGSHGSVVYADGCSVHVPCHPILGVDLTGCGDAYAVGYLAARSDGLSPVAAARRATALVALLLSNRKRVRH
jgi:sugar/nucleoside kinase (ribokinase family)